MYESKHDWSIHKKLAEDGTVYIMPARANGKPLRQLEIYTEIFKSGKIIRLLSLPSLERSCDMIDKNLHIKIIKENFSD